MKPDRSRNYVALQVPVYSNMGKAKERMCFILLDLFVLFFPCIRVLHSCLLDNSWCSSSSQLSQLNLHCQVVEGAQ